jgi:subtilisin family serine protease
MPDPAKEFESPVIHQQLKASGVAQVIVVMKSAAAAAAGRPEAASLMRRFRSSELSQTSALEEARGLAAGRRGAAKARAHAAKASGPRVYPNLGVMYGTVDAQGLAALRSDARVSAVTGAPVLSLIRPTAVRAAKLTEEVTWGIEALGVPKLWGEGLTGKAVRVAHLDTGVDGKHPALKGALSAFAEFDEVGQIVRPAPAPYDSDEHGTHTAATIAGRPVGGRAMGVAPKSQLASALVIEGGDAVARVLGGLDWSLGQGVKVLSMSLGFRGWWEDFLPIVQILRSRGVLPVIAVGNEYAGTSRSPGNYSESLSVGAADERLGVASFSSSQRFARTRDPIVPDVVAPGVNVLSAKPGGGFQLMDGSSMATPHVAGLAALLFEAKPSASVGDVESAIFQSCKLHPRMTEARAGRGLPDAPEALRVLTGLTYAPGKKPARKKPARRPARRGQRGARRR